MRWLPNSVLVAAAIWLLGVSGASAPRRPDKAELIPESLATYLKESYPDLSILPKDRAIGELLQYFANEIKGQPSPFVCSGDFDGDGREDYALVLWDKARSGLKVHAFHQTAGHSYTTFLIQDMPGVIPGNNRTEVYIVCEPPQTKKIHGRLVRLAHASITLGFYEKAADLYFFAQQSNRYKKISLSD